MVKPDTARAELRLEHAVLLIMIMIMMMMTMPFGVTTPLQALLAYLRAADSPRPRFV